MSATAPPAARGDEFAPAFEGEATGRGFTADDVFSGGSISDFVSFFSGQGPKPSGFTNANILDSKIQKLDSQTFGLPQYGQSQFDLPEEGGGVGEGLESLYGFDEEKKKKKNTDYRVFAKDGGEDISYKFGPDERRVDPITEQMLDALRQMRQTTDRNTAEQVAAIEGRFDERRAQQERSNAQNLAAVKQALNLGGSSRYAPISSQGIVGAAEAAGIRNLSALDAEERDLVSQARQAQAANDYRLLEQKLNILEGVRSQKAEAMSELSTTMQETQMASERDGMIAELVSQGITNPVEIFQQISDQGFPISLKQISESLSYITPKGSATGGFKWDTKQVGPLLGMGFSMSDVQAMQDDLNAGQSIDEVLAGVPDEMQQAVRSALGVPQASNLRPGVGAKDAITEQMIRTRLFPKAASILNKGTLSDADREIIDERIAYFRDSGLSEQQILDVFSGWSADVSTPFNNSFRDIILATQETQEGVSQNLTPLGSLLARGKYEIAMNRVENSALETVKDEDGYLGKITTENYTRKIDRIKKLLKEGGAWDGVGPLEGSFQNIVRRIKGKDATRIKGELSALYSDFRRENAGTAVTENELVFLDPLFASVTDTKGNFLEKLDVFQRSLLDRHNSTRRAATLPEVRVVDILDPNERLRLYMEQQSSRDVNSIEI